MPSKNTSVLVGGVVTAVVALMISYASLQGGFPPNPVYGCAGCLVYLFSGFVAVWHYTRAYEVTLTGKQGVVLGALSGLCAGIIVTVVTYLLTAAGIMPSPVEMLEKLDSSGIMDTPGAEFAIRIAEMMQGPVGFFLGLIQNSIFGAVLGLTGGAVGRAVWRGKALEAEDD